MKIKNKQFILAVSGVSGSGKSSILAALYKYPDQFASSVSYTSRPPRSGEIEGREYHFVSDQEFETAINGGEFLEWENVHGQKYGTKKDDIVSIINSGKIPILELDVKGVTNIKNIFKKVVSVFVMPPSLEEAERRLANRQTESEQERSLRTERYQMEIGYKKKYDHIIINDDLKQAQDKLLKIVENEKRKPSELFRWLTVSILCLFLFSYSGVNVYFDHRQDLLNAKIAQTNEALQSAPDKSQTESPEQSQVIVAPPPAEVKAEISKKPPKYGTSNPVDQTKSNGDGTSTSTISTGGGVSSSDISRVDSYSGTTSRPADVTFRDETGTHSDLETVLKDYLTNTLKWRSEISSLKEITLRNAGATGWSGQYVGSYTVSADGRKIVSETGFIILNSYYSEGSSYFNDYAKLVLSHEYGHHYTLYHKWIDWNLPIGTRFPDSYYTTRPLSKTTTATDYSLGWQNCESEIIAEDYSYEYSGYGQINSQIRSLYGVPSAATKTFLDKIGDPSLLNPSVNTPPRVVILSPLAGTVSGTVSFSADASDDVGVSSVSFYVDNTLLEKDTSAPYQSSLDTTLFGNGAHVLKAVASDGSLTTEASENISIDNPTDQPDIQNPTISITAPTDNPYSWTTGELAIDLTAIDNNTIKKIDVFIDDVKQNGWEAGTGEVYPSLQLHYTMKRASAGTYVIKFIAVDAAGNESTPATITIVKS